MANDKFIVHGLGGKRKLSGTIAVSGAKNAALKAMASSLLFRNTIVLKNVPEIEDVKRMGELLLHLGSKVERLGSGTIRILSGNKIRGDLPNNIAKKMRASLVVSGPLLARTGKISFPHPGGCVIGERPIDFFIEGFKKMGATVRISGRSRKKIYIISTKEKKLRGANIFFQYQSVTGTETFMMAAVLAKGVTVIQNAALEPEIKSLATFLNNSGAHIEGAGTSTIIIRGGGLLFAKKSFITVPDRIEAGSFLILGALAAIKLKIINCNPKHLDALLQMLKKMGVIIRENKSSITVSNGHKTKKRFNIINIKTHEYPGFPTDLQAPMTVFLTQAKGEAIVFETIFEGRLNYIESLQRMGGNITPMDAHRVLVFGPTVLRGRKLESPDLRAGLAFVIAAIIARGKSTIHNVYNIDRGYEHIDERLKKIGVNITRVGEVLK